MRWDFVGAVISERMHDNGGTIIQTGRKQHLAKEVKSVAFDIIKPRLKPLGNMLDKTRSGIRQGFVHGKKPTLKTFVLMRGSRDINGVLVNWVTAVHGQPQNGQP